MAAYQNLAQEIIKAIESGGTNHPTTVANAMVDYLIQNTLIIVNYSGIIPGVPPLPDPIVVDALKIKGSCAPLNNTDIDSYISSIDSNISSGIELDLGIAGIKPQLPTLAFKTGLKLVQEDINSAHKSQIYLWEKIEEFPENNYKDFIIIADLKNIPSSVEVDDIGIFSGGYYKCSMNPNPPNPQKVIWEKISEKIIEWLETCSIGLSFDAQNTKSGSTGKATIVKTEIL